MGVGAAVGRGSPPARTATHFEPIVWPAQLVGASAALAHAPALSCTSVRGGGSSAAPCVGGVIGAIVLEDSR